MKSVTIIPSDGTQLGGFHTVPKVDYDGLVNPGTCACETDDLSPASCMNETECEAGHKIKPDPTVECDCPLDDGPCACDWHMEPGERPKAKRKAKR